MYNKEDGSGTLHQHYMVQMLIMIHVFEMVVADKCYVSWVTIAVTVITIKSNLGFDYKYMMVYILEGAKGCTI